MGRPKKQQTPESIARSLLPKTITMDIDTEFEVQIGNQAFLYKFTSNVPPYGKWELIETNQLGEIKRGRPRKVVQEEAPKKLLIPNLVHTPQELARISAMTNLEHVRNEDVDGVPVPVFCKTKKAV